MTQQNQITPSALPPEVQKVVTRFEEKYGIELSSILQDTMKSVRVRRNEIARTIIEAVWSHIDKGHEQRGTKYLSTGADEQFKKKLKNNELEILPCFVMDKRDVENLKSKNGQDLVDHLNREMDRFGTLVTAENEPSYASTMLIGGIRSIGTLMLQGTAVAIRAGSPLNAAVLQGVKSIGLKSSIGYAALILGGLILWLLNELERSITGIAINESTEPLIVKNWQNGISGGSHDSDLWMEHGEMITFTMEDSEYNGTNGEEEVFLPPAEDWELEGIQCMCGYICADEDAIVAGECAYALQVTTYETNKAIHLLATSPTIGTSGVLVDLNTPLGADLEQFFNDNVDGKNLESSKESGSFGAYMKMDSQTPGHRVIIASIYPTI